MNYCKENGILFDATRTIEPPDIVYKKCIGGVIVCATIPKDAEIRGSFNKKCRTNKAMVVDIIGDICGERIGMSKYDLKTFYEIGDEIIVENFDFSNAECSTGFHFFCTKKEAEEY